MKFRLDTKACTKHNTCPQGEICGIIKPEAKCDEKSIKQLIARYEPWIRQEAIQKLGPELAAQSSLEDLLLLLHESSTGSTLEKMCKNLALLIQDKKHRCHPCPLTQDLKLSAEEEKKFLSYVFAKYQDTFLRMQAAKDAWKYSIGRDIPPPSTGLEMYQTLFGPQVPSCSTVANLQRFATMSPEEKITTLPVYTFKWEDSSCFCDSLFLALLANKNTWIIDELGRFSTKLQDWKGYNLCASTEINRLENKMQALRPLAAAGNQDARKQLQAYELRLANEKKQHVAHEKEVCERVYQETNRVFEAMHSPRKKSGSINRIATDIRRLVDKCESTGEFAKYHKTTADAKEFLTRLLQLLLMYENVIDVTKTVSYETRSQTNQVIFSEVASVETQKAPIIVQLQSPVEEKGKPGIRLADLLQPEVAEARGRHQGEIKVIQTAIKKAPYAIFYFPRNIGTLKKQVYNSIRVEVQPEIKLGESKMLLNSVVCYEPGHYVVFFRVGQSWFYYNDFAYPGRRLDQMSFDLMQKFVQRNGILYFYSNAEREAKQPMPRVFAPPSPQTPPPPPIPYHFEEKQKKQEEEEIPPPPYPWHLEKRKKEEKEEEIPPPPPGSPPRSLSKRPVLSKLSTSRNRMETKFKSQPRFPTPPPRFPAPPPVFSFDFPPPPISQKPLANKQPIKNLPATFGQSWS